MGVEQPAALEYEAAMIGPRRLLDNGMTQNASKPED